MTTVQDFAEQVCVGDFTINWPNRPIWTIEFQLRRLVLQIYRPGRHYTVFRRTSLFSEAFCRQKSASTSTSLFCQSRTLDHWTDGALFIEVSRFSNTFQKGLVHTITEEQEHLRLYLDRLQSWAVRSGRYQSMPSPQDYSLEWRTLWIL